MHSAYIALGSNLDSAHGSPEATLRAAIVQLGACGQVMAQSSIYRTEPVEYVDQPSFANAVVDLKTELEPEALLEQMLAIEREFGRDRRVGPPKGPRTLDLDLLMVDDLVRNSEQLVLPHPAMAERRFVLAPLAEIAPGLVHPLLRKTIAELLRRLPAEGQNRPAAVLPLPEPGDPR